MRTLFLFISALVLAHPAGAFANDKLHGSILQVFVTSTYPNHNEPWQSYGQFRKSGSGVIIAGNRILTNAHVVQDASFIEVKKANDTRKYIANLEVIAHDVDLALLTVADRKFYDGVTPLEIGVLPNLRDKVAVYGFPQGGTTLSVTEGIVSRIEVTDTAQDNTPVLAIQIDAAVNYGNSGGPVLLAGKVAGIAFQSLSGGQNINYVLSPPAIDRFLADIADGTYDGVPDIEADVQIVENEDMKRFYGLLEGQGGILLRSIKSPRLAGILQEGDVITAIDGYVVDNEGYITYRKGIRVFANVPILQKQVGDTIALTVIRDRKARSVRVPLAVAYSRNRLVPRAVRERNAPYYILGGLVFTKLTNALVYKQKECESWERLPSLLKEDYLDEGILGERKEIVVLNKVLPDQVNAGYVIREPERVTKANTVSIGSLQDLIRAVEGNQGAYHVIDTDDGRYILDRANAALRTPVILKKYGIPADRSEDLR